MAYGDRQDGSSRVVSIVFVVIIHALLLFVLVNGLAPNLVQNVKEGITSVVIEPPPPPPPPEEIPPPPPARPDAGGGAAAGVQSAAHRPATSTADSARGAGTAAGGASGTDDPGDPDL